LDEFRSENKRLTIENEHLQTEVDRLQSLHKAAEDSSAELNALREHVRILLLFFYKIISILV